MAQDNCCIIKEQAGRLMSPGYLMEYKLHFDTSWQCGGVRIHSGTYRVPDDIAEESAQQAMREGVAVKVVPKVAPENKGNDVNPSETLGRRFLGSGQAKPSPSSQADPASPPSKPKRSRVKRDV